MILVEAYVLSLRALDYLLEIDFRRNAILNLEV